MTTRTEFEAALKRMDTLCMELLHKQAASARRGLRGLHDNDGIDAELMSGEELVCRDARVIADYVNEREAREAELSALVEEAKESVDAVLDSAEKAARSARTAVQNPTPKNRASAEKAIEKLADNAEKAVDTVDRPNPASTTGMVALVYRADDRMLVGRFEGADPVATLTNLLHQAGGMAGDAEVSKTKDGAKFECDVPPDELDETAVRVMATATGRGHRVMPLEWKLNGDRKRRAAFSFRHDKRHLIGHPLVASVVQKGRRMLVYFQEPLIEPVAEWFVRQGFSRIGDSAMTAPESLVEELLPFFQNGTDSLERADDGDDNDDNDDDNEGECLPCQRAERRRSGGLFLGDDGDDDTESFE